ncbi:MAG: sulfatase-like hydrolase/transferase [Balneolaceae bacterium]
MKNYFNKNSRSDYGNIYLAFFFTITFLIPLSGLAQTNEQSPRPNILFAISDDQSFPHMGAYGTGWVQTPAFDRVAEEGVLFNRAYVPNPKCAPSRAIILTGRNSWQLEEAANHWPYFPQKFKVYTEVLAENGYFVGATGKKWAPGIAVTADGEPRHLAGQPYDEHRAEPPTSTISNNDYAANFQAFLEERPSGQPFSFWYGATEPHRAYEYRSGIEKGGKTLPDIDEVPGFWPDEEEIRIDMLDYAFEIEHFDSHLGRMLEQLEELGELDNTIVVVTADNGMPFPRIKGQAYEQSAHMPLAIMWPDVIDHPGRVVDDFVSFADFAPTFMELAGLDWEDTGMHPPVGRSLTDILNSASEGQVNPERDYILLGKERHDIGRPYDWGYPIRGIIRGDMLYIHNFEPTRWPVGNPETGYLNTDGSPTKTFILDNRTTPGMYHYWAWNFGKRPSEELYNIADDPGCIHNLAGDPAHQETVNILKMELFDRLRDQEDPRMFGRGYVFDAYPYMDEGTRNFYQRFMEGEQMNTGWVNDSDFEVKPLPEQSQ